eukprot:1194606-Prorocentrum_minimum.AAC.3
MNSKTGVVHSQAGTMHSQTGMVVWSSEDAQRASTPTTDRESRCTPDDQRRRLRAPALNY